MKPLRDLCSDAGVSDALGSALAASSQTGKGLVGAVLLCFLLATSVDGPSLGEQLFHEASDVALSLRFVAPDTTSRTASSPPPAPGLRALAAHPSTKFPPYMTPGAPTSAATNPSVLSDFHALLDQFAQRQVKDDNFSVRVIDRRTDDVLELYELTDLRRAYNRGAPVDWRAVDQRRRAVTNTLVDKYERKGVPLEDIIVRWGRANQIERAWERNRPYRAYEVRLAQHLGLSLLATQISTVETFNKDDLVSSAGAKSRYQMLPRLLRRNGVHTYSLPTTAGSRVEVEEARHPLLTMEPAFLLLRGYVNAVGHEIPGLSAYHTGPGNIYMLYRTYFTESSHYAPSATVVDAYIWAVTEGFDTVRDGTSFGPFSRGYVPSLHGAMKAQDRRPVDPTAAVRAARVQLAPGSYASLREVLTVLDTTARSFDWGPAAEQPSTYARFRGLNDHFALPASPTGGVPAAGNVRLFSSIGGKDVRFFLPLGAPTALREAGLNVLDPDRTMRFDASTFAPPTDAQRTKWDERYSALVDDIGRFGFTPANRDRLLRLHDKFERLAEDRPSPYRRRQLDIIRTHRRIWRSDAWDKLSALTMQVTGRAAPPTHPPVEIPGVGPSAEVP